MEFPKEIHDILELTEINIKVDSLNKYAFENRNINPKLSLEVSEKALEFSESASYDKGKADSLLNMGFYHMHGSNHERALTDLLKATALYNELNDLHGVANAQYNIGLVQVRIGNFAEAIEIFHKSLAYREKHNELAGIAMCYFQITYINQHFNDWDAAYENASKAHQIQTQLKNKAGIAATLMILGDIYLHRKELDKAKEVLAESIAIRKDLKEDLGLFASVLRWTELHIELKEFDVARKFAIEGLEMAKKADISFGVVRFLQTIGKMEVALGNLEAAKQKYLEALDYTKNLFLKSIAYDIHRAISEIYAAEHDYKKALEHFILYNKIKDEVVSFESNARLKSVQLTTQIEFAQKEAELEKEKNTELNEAYKIISEKQKEIIDSIHYAKRIQESLLPNDIYIERNLQRLYKKD